MRMHSRPRPPRSAAARLAVPLLATLALVLPALASAQEATAPRIESVVYDVPSATLTIEVAGQLDAASTTVLVDGSLAPIESFDSAPASAGTLLIAIEASSSTAFTPYGVGTMLQAQQAAAIDLVRSLPASVEAGVVVFGDGASILVSPSTDHEAAAAAIAGITAGSTSALHDGLAVASELLRDGARPGVLALFTYGWDFGGTGAVTASQSAALVAASGATVYAYALGFDYNSPYLGDIASASGGALHRDLVAAGLEAARSAFGASGSHTLTVPLALEGGPHEVVVRTPLGEALGGFASAAPSAPSELTVAERAGEAAATLELDVLGAPADSVVTVELSGAEPRALAPGEPGVVDFWAHEPGTLVVKLTTWLDGAVIAELRHTVAVPVLEPELTLAPHPTAADGTYEVAARIQGGVPATLIVEVDGDEVVNTSEPRASFEVGGGREISARIHDAAGLPAAVQTLILEAPAIGDGGEAASFDWRWLAAGALVLGATVLLMLLVLRKRRASRAPRGPQRPRGRRFRRGHVRSEPLAIMSAAESGELALHFQPVFDATGEHVAGAEALLRWDDPDGGVSSARHFLSRTVAAGMLPDMTAWAMRSACKFAVEMQADGLADFRVTVNLSIGQLLSDDLLEAVRNALQVTALEARYLEVELTEMSVLGKRSAVTPVLEQLRDLGVGVSIDDFWAPGGSSEAIDLPGVGSVKVDLWSNTGSAPAREQITAAVALARERGLATVAKRVETVHEMGFFRTLECGYVQGNAFGAPMAPAEFVRRMSEINEAPRLAG